MNRLPSPLRVAFRINQQLASAKTANLLKGSCLTAYQRPARSPTADERGVRMGSKRKCVRNRKPFCVRATRWSTSGTSFWTKTTLWAFPRPVFAVLLILRSEPHQLAKQHIEDECRLWNKRVCHTLGRYCHLFGRRWLSIYSRSYCATFCFQSIAAHH